MRHLLAPLLVSVLLSLPAAAVDAPLVDCPPAGLGGDTFGDQNFYVMEYPGRTLGDLTLYLQFPGSGTWVLSSTARQDTFDGSVIGTAQATVTVTTDRYLPVTFHFGGAAVAADSVITFRQSVVSGTQSGLYFAVLTQPGCTAVETGGSAPPLATFWRSGVALRITGTAAASQRTLTIPAVASIHGANGSFFHSDVWLFNLFPQNLGITATYHCYAGQSCGSGSASFTLPSAATRTITDMAGSFFGAPDSAGAVVLTFNAPYALSGLLAASRVYTPSLPSPTNGAAVPALPISSATGSAVFVGIANNGATRTSGFRTNAGAYNPLPYPASVTFSLYRSNPAGLANGDLLGTYTGTWGPNEAKQVNDIFAACGVGSAVTNGAVLFVRSALPLFPYVTVIDNVTGDSVVQGPTSY